ncbi:hypothetical protein, partial [Phaeospirillum tilakii]
MAPRALSFLLVLVLGWPAAALAQDKTESRSETGKMVDAVIDGVGDFLNVLGGPPISSPNAFLNLPGAATGDDSATPAEKQPAAAPAPAHPAVAVPAAPPPATPEATPATTAPTTPPRRQTPRPATAAAP